MKSKKLEEARFLSALQRILPKSIQDPHLVSTIYEQVLAEMRVFKNLENFEKFAAKGALPDAEPNTIAEFQDQLSLNFGQDNVSVTPQEDGTAVAVEIALPDHILNTTVKVAP